jgi:PAS domain S-box-containing protein
MIPKTEVTSSETQNESPMTRNEESPLLWARNITKSIEGAMLLDSVDLELNSGQVHVLYGENGAGKTTFIKAITGAWPYDGGEVFIRGKRINFDEPYQAYSLGGISAVYQECTLIDELNVAVNLFLGSPARRSILMADRHLCEKASLYLNQLDFAHDIDPREKVANLSAGQKQQIKVAKGLMQDSPIVILDDPTSFLSDEETLAVYKAINTLRSKGKGVLCASHKVDEAIMIADRVTIIRDGYKVDLLKDKKEITSRNILRGLGGVIFKWKATQGRPIEFVSQNISSELGYKASNIVKGKREYNDFIHPDYIGSVDNLLRQSIVSNLDRFEQDYQVVCQNGEYKWIHELTSPIRDLDGKITHYLGVILDINEDKKKENALRLSERKYESLIKNVPGIVYSLLPGRTNAIDFISNRCQVWTGYSPDDIYEDYGKWLSCIEPQDRDRVTEVIQKSYLSKREYTLEYRLYHKDTGAMRYIQDSGTPVSDEQGNIVGYDGLMSDRTEQRKLEAELVENEEFLSTVLSNAPNPIIVINEDTSIEYVNPALERLTGFSNSEVVNCKEPYPWYVDKKAQKASSFSEMYGAESAHHGEELFRKKDGQNFWVEVVSVSVKHVGEFRYRIDSWNDVTREKRLAENLRSYAKLLTDLQENERKRISEDLHDETLQALFGVCSDIDAFINEKKLSHETLEVLRKTQAKIGVMMDETRRFCHNLRPGVIDRFGLIPSLKLQVQEINQQNTFECFLSVIGRARRLPADTELVVFRIVQEALNNIRKHANSTKVEIQIEYGISNTKTFVRDDGVGFNVPEKIDDLVIEGKLGLIGMQERVNSIGGKLSINSVLGKGTVIAVDIPN